MLVVSYTAYAVGFVLIPQVCPRSEKPIHCQLTGATVLSSKSKEIQMQ